MCLPDSRLIASANSPWELILQITLAAAAAATFLSPTETSRRRLTPSRNSQWSVHSTCSPSSGSSNAPSTSAPKGTSNRTDLLSRFMSVADDAYLRDIIVSFILAGRDSVTSALTAFFLLISGHPAVEAAILRETEAVVGLLTDDVAPNFEQIRRLNYLQAAVYETMRLYPPVQFDSKFCQNDDVLPDGTEVAKGTRVTYHTYAMGRMEEIWGKDCLDFKPERWLKKNKENDVVSFWFSCESAYKYPVFQAGVRVCLGKEMAIMQIKIVALSLLRRFRFPVAGGGGVPRFSPGLTATLHGGLPVMVVHRRDDTNTSQ